MSPKAVSETITRAWGKLLQAGITELPTPPAMTPPDPLQPPCIATPLTIETLIKDSRPVVLRVVNSIRFHNPIADRDDLEQVANINLPKIAPKWNPKRGASFDTFLTQCLHRKLLSHLKKFRGRPTPVSLSCQDEQEPHQYQDPCQESPSNRPELMDEANHYLQAMSPRDQTIVRELARGRTYAQIAQSQALSLHGVKSRVMRLRRRALAMRRQREDRER
jgi:RNA polymerase sigma factor (sigma-70 family)